MTDKQKELLAKYNRVAEDKSQLQQFAQEVIMNEIVEGGTKLYKHTIDLGAGGKTLIIISNDQTIITFTNFNDFINDAKIMSGSIGYGNSKVNVFAFAYYSYNGTSHILAITKQWSGGSVSETINDITFFESSDIVTEL